MRLVVSLLCAAALCSVAVLAGASIGGRAEYIGGTLPSITEKTDGLLITSSPYSLTFQVKRLEVRVPYERINLLEYGQKVDRRYLAAVLLSPMFLLSKSRAHFLTIGYEDDEGKQQAMVFRVSKGDIRTVLVSLEARTGRKVQFQDDEARKAGKG